MVTNVHQNARAMLSYWDWRYIETQDSLRLYGYSHRNVAVVASGDTDCNAHGLFSPALYVSTFCVSFSALLPRNSGFVISRNEFGSPREVEDTVTGQLYEYTCSQYPPTPFHRPRSMKYMSDEKRTTPIVISNSNMLSALKDLTMVSANRSTLLFDVRSSLNNRASRKTRITPTPGISSAFPAIGKEKCQSFVQCV